MVVLGVVVVAGAAVLLVDVGIEVVVEGLGVSASPRAGATTASSITASSGSEVLLDVVGLVVVVLVVVVVVLVVVVVVAVSSGDTATGSGG